MDTVIYGDRSPSTSSVKFITLLSVFLVAFTSFVQSARYFLHASFLMSTPDSDIPVSYVQKAVIRGGNFWSVGLRSLYFATTLVLWIFGPIPMFACSLSTVVVLHFLDSNSTPLHKYRPPLGQGPGKTTRQQQNNKTQVTHPMSTQSSNISWVFFFFFWWEAEVIFFMGVISHALQQWRTTHIRRHWFSLASANLSVFTYDE